MILADPTTGAAAVIAGLISYAGGYAHGQLVARPRPRKRGNMLDIQPIDPRAWLMSEDKGPGSLEAHVRRLLTEYGLHGHHSSVSVGDEAGWPDWFIWGRHGKYARELKSQRGTLSVDQRRVGSELQAVGINWAVWKPVDFFNLTIHRQLERIAW